LDANRTFFLYDFLSAFLAHNNVVAWLEYDIPTIRSTGMPPARDVVSSPFDDIGRLAGEGGVTDDAVMAGRRMAQERLAAEEAFRARQLAGMEGEGGTEFVLRLE
jgi:hypothetical protein